jgi:hypothetical protein
MATSLQAGPLEFRLNYGIFVVRNMLSLLTATKFVITCRGDVSGSVGAGAAAAVVQGDRPLAGP